MTAAGPQTKARYELDGSRESSKLSLLLLRDTAAVPGHGSVARTNCVNYDQNCIDHDGAVTCRKLDGLHVVADQPAVHSKDRWAFNRKLSSDTH
jgi:hypothetical protein